jgi:hypothetical protein
MEMSGAWVMNEAFAVLARRGKGRAIALGE